MDARGNTKMLRITMSVSGEEAAKYFDSALQTSDYYGSENGLWGGKGAERLGLVGDVKREDFVSLASNKLPGTDQTLTVRIMEKRRSGYDFTFSVLKSVSLFIADAAEEAVERMSHEHLAESMDDID